MSARTVAQAVAVGRIAIGAGLIAAPGHAGAQWIGADAHRGPTSVLSRGFGGREIGLGLGTLLSLRDGLTTKHLLRAGVISDAADFFGTWAARRELPRTGAYGTLAIAGGAVAIGAALANRLD
jgi:hypothetical protein